MSTHSKSYQQTKNHYQNLLSQHYTWLFAAGKDPSHNSTFFQDTLANEKLRVEKILDLGCGNGAQSIPLLEAFSSSIIYCIDSSSFLLNELKQKLSANQVNRVNLLEGDLLLFPTLVTSSQFDLIVCMGDTLTHLASLSEVFTLFKHCFDSLNSGGILLLQFRDLTEELFNGDRFIPIKSDERTVFTCFLEWTIDEQEVDDNIADGLTQDGSGRIIKVHDLVHVKKGIGAWELCTSWYKKLALSPLACATLLKSVGFSKTSSSLSSDGMHLFEAKK